MRINKELAIGFGKLIEGLPAVVRVYDINISAMCREIGMARKTYYLKLKNKTFTLEEMIKICNYINR